MANTTQQSNRPQSLTEMDYQATGNLVGSVQCINKTRFIIIVQRGQDYVVSRYQNGQSEWESGNYFKDSQKAFEKFVEMVDRYCL